MKSLILWAFALFCLLYASVWATGQTFGQRCTAMGYTAPAHSECVRTLANGEAMP